jgi:phosphoribosyl-ATP pyrophosphohydrolase/phosphoribosyl-AMP cyclohydrolase/histidinol dehydrogenase
MIPLLRTISPAEVPVRRDSAVDPEVLRGARAIVEDVLERGEAAVREHGERLGDIEPGAPLVVDRAALREAFERLPPEQQSLLERVAGRIRSFAEAQRSAIADVRAPVPGGWASHRVTPVARAGCYAPGGRYPLPSSVLMTAVTARAAGVGEVIVASPRPASITLAAAHVAGANALLAVGGAQAVAAMAMGIPGAMSACDVIAGPGNRWVTAAKQVVSDRVGIDMLAGPSELVIVAGGDADPGIVAADLLAQAEHDTEALPILISLDGGLIERVNAALAEQLATLPTAATAREALGKGFAVHVDSVEEAIRLCDAISPEHLQLSGRLPRAAALQFSNYGALFIGERTAEVFGDYGAGPNHVLPTGGTARYASGLSVLSFLRVRTQLELDIGGRAMDELIADTMAMARLEGLEGHARAAEARMPCRSRSAVGEICPGD